MSLKKIKIIKIKTTDKNLDDFTDLSKDITKSLSDKEKKDNGIYFTPPPIIQEIIDFIRGIYPNPKLILEPSCGSGEFLRFLIKTFDKSKLNAIEYNEKIYNKINGIYKCNIINFDYLKYHPKHKYDLIIGNPPYFVLPKKNIDKKYLEYFDGRPNIYILFIIKSLELLNKNGIVAFVLPNNFMNCMYYNKLRQYLYDNYQILLIKDHSDKKYLNTNQDTCVLIVRESINKNDLNILNQNFCYKINNNIIFNETQKINKLKEYFQDSTTLKEMGFKVKVGNVVWNQCKDILTNDNTKTRLIYSGDLKNNQLVLTDYKNGQKKNYIDKSGIIDLLLIVNRGYGKGQYNFNYCLIDTEKPYLVENHLICIESKLKISREELKKKYNQIIKSFENQKTVEFINLYFSNNAINTKELEEILPIYLE